MRPKRKSFILPSTRDIQILQFLWRWKLATTRALALKFFPERRSDGGYNRLNQLKNAGYIQLVALEMGGEHFAWTLTPKGFKCVSNLLPELKEAGFKSENPEHDLIVSAVHLGNWLIHQPTSVDIFTEQELRRYHPDCYPQWVPKSDQHRPDGYWRVPYKNQMVTIALEVERSIQCNHKYELVARYYDDIPSVIRVVWIIQSPSTAKTMQKLFLKKVKAHALIHTFVLEREFEKLGWQAPVLLGYERGKPLSFILTTDVAGALQARCGCNVTAILDTRKRPVISMTQEKNSNHENLLCVSLRVSAHEPPTLIEGVDSE